MKQYSTYIFDLDGTLLDTLGDLAASCNYALREMKMPERSVDEVRRFVGNGVKKLMERAVPEGTSEEKAEQALEIFRAYYLVHNLDSTAPYEGINELLTELKRRGKNVAVVSNKFYDATRQLCQYFFPDTIQVAIGEKDGIKKKPAPDTVVEAFRQLGVTSEDAVYVGDSEVDIQTAQNCGIPCISVLWGFRDKEFLIAHEATTFAVKPEDLL